MQLVLNGADFLSGRSGVPHQLVVELQRQRHPLRQLHVQLVTLLLPLLVLPEGEDLLRLVDTVLTLLGLRQVDWLAHCDVRLFLEPPLFDLFDLHWLLRDFLEGTRDFGLSDLGEVADEEIIIEVIRIGYKFKFFIVILKA
jgi:hypothetical protein